MDLSAFSDEELMAIAGQGASSFDPYSFAEQEAAAVGLPPGLVSRVVRQESGGRLDAVSPKGARGPMQLMPATARELGVNIDDPEDNIRGGVRYLKQQFDAFGTPELALAAYNAGPGAVRRYGGVPPYAETQDYVASIQGGDMPAQPMQTDLSGFTDEELARIAGVELGPREVGRTANGGVTIDVEPATAPQPIPTRSGRPAAPTIAQDAVSGLLAPFKTLGADIVNDYRRVTSRASQPLPSIGEAVQDSIGDFASKARILGDVLGLAGAPVMAAVRPAARAINRTGLPIYERPKMQDIGKGKAPQRITDPNQRQAVIEGTINTALSAAKPASPVARAPAAKPMNLEQLKRAKTAAYQVVDDLGVAYSPKAGAILADNIGYDLATKRINPKVTPKAHAVMEDVIEQLRSGNPIRLDQLDDMRQQVWLATGKGDDAEQFFGQRIRDLIDEFIDTAGPGQVLNGDGPQAAAALAKARDLNTRWRKAQEVTNRVESADLRAASTYAGGNKANAARQKLRPLIDPKSNQQIRNLTPAERAALNKVVRGSGPANAARVTGKLLDPRGLLGAAVQTIGGSTTGGATTLSIPLGMAASEVSNALTLKGINDLLRLISVGGTKPGSLPPVNSILALGGRPAITLRSIPGLVGAAEVAAPLARIPSAPPKKKAATKARAAPRKK